MPGFAGDRGQRKAEPGQAEAEGPEHIDPAGIADPPLIGPGRRHDEDQENRSEQDRDDHRMGISSNGIMFNRAVHRFR
jgi:hypothetical protein